MNLYDGWIILDKPKGIGSTDAVQKVRRFLGRENKVGHAGTLDPLAQGVLPIAVGEATKTVQYLMDAKKEYEFTVTWGEERATGDAEGEVVAQGGHIPTIKEIEQVLPEFLGEIMQMPPIYSALKIKGQPAYKLARMGVEVELSPRKVMIYKLELMHHDENKGESSFKVECGKGTYVRSLAVDIARVLATYAYVSHLERTRVGSFFIKDAITLANLINLVHNDEIKLHFLPVTFGLGDILAIEVSAEQAKYLKHGVQIFLQDYAENSEATIQILSNGILQGLVSMKNGLCKPIRMFNLI